VVYALDAATGEELWFFDPKVSRVDTARSCCGAVNRGVAYADDKIFLAALDGRLIALDWKTGEVRWQTQTIDDPSEPYVITGAPRIAEDVVVIGNSGADLGVRGYAGAYDLQTGEQVWRFYTVPGNPADGPDGAASDSIMEAAAATWTGEWWSEGGGGTVWDSITYDPELDRVYLGVGNGAPWNRQFRSPEGGDNWFLASIVAVDRASGEYIWHYQATPGDTWDATATQSMILATIEFEGEPRHVLMQAPKNGFFYVIDRQNGTLLTAGNIVPMARTEDTPEERPISWAYGIDLETGRPLENPEARYEDGGPVTVHPTGNGAHGWQPMAYSPDTGLIYMPIQDPASTFTHDPDYRPGPGLRSSGTRPPGALPHDEAIRTSIRQSLNAALIAWDPIRQEEVWRVPFDYGGNGGALVTAGGLVFESNGEGTFAAYEARTGALLWSFDAQATAQGGPIAYAIDGEQYIAIAVGNGGSSFIAAGLFAPQRRSLPVGRVVVFKLGGEGSYERVDTALAPVPEPPDITLSPVRLDDVAARYGAYCAGCHGFGAVSGQVTPDLRRTAYIQTREAFYAVVGEGLLAERGMPRFGDQLDGDQIEELRAFIAREARFLRGEIEASSAATGSVNAAIGVQ
jgi:PQQ-dependent dehydrogenase (methanol/ethanol family)